MTAIARLEELWAKIDAFAARVASRYPGELACAPGCSECCHRRFSVTGVEARVIAAFVRALAPEARAAIDTRLREGLACAALDDEGRCRLYAVRPVVCRSHGLPIRFTPHPTRDPSEPRAPASGQDLADRSLTVAVLKTPETTRVPSEPRASASGQPLGDRRLTVAADERVRLPVVDACYKNFTGRGLGSIEGPCVLDQATLSTLVAAIDGADADATGRPRGTRRELDAVLAESI